MQGERGSVMSHLFAGKFKHVYFASVGKCRTFCRGEVGAGRESKGKMPRSIISKVCWLVANRPVFPGAPSVPTHRIHPSPENEVLRYECPRRPCVRNCKPARSAYRSPVSPPTHKSYAPLSIACTVRTLAYAEASSFFSTALLPPSYIRLASVNKNPPDQRADATHTARAVAPPLA